MITNTLIEALDEEIARLQHARTILVGNVPTKKKVYNLAKDANPKPEKKRRKRNLSPEGRARIAAAVKLRWEKARKAGITVGKGQGSPSQAAIAAKTAAKKAAAVKKSTAQQPTADATT